jgi:hypothetical protein
MPAKSQGSDNIEFRPRGPSDHLLPSRLSWGYDAVLVGRAEHHLGRVGPWALPTPVTVRRPTSQSPGATPSPVPPSSHHAVAAQQKRQIPSRPIYPVLPFPSISTAPSSPAKPGLSSWLSFAVGSARPCAVLHVACTTLLQATYTHLRASPSPPVGQPSSPVTSTPSSDRPLPFWLSLPCVAGRSSTDFSRPFFFFFLLSQPNIHASGAVPTWFYSPTDAKAPQRS